MATVPTVLAALYLYIALKYRKVPPAYLNMSMRQYDTLATL